MADTSRLGRYEIRREIARSNDIVYEAVDPTLGRRVALKELVLPPNLVGQAKRERVERFYREARAAGSLTHPNIVTIFEVGEDDGRHFIAMEYLEGETLRQALDTGGAMPVSRVVDILRQTLDALGYSHAHGVVHRDVKPDNIYLLPDGAVKLTDFGIARIMEEPSLTSAGQVFGTPSYMSPEQIAGKPMDERTDLYSVGVMAYEMLAGRKPFVGENVVALTYQILNVDPTSPSGIPPGLAEVLRIGMAKDPAARYQTAKQMSDALLAANAPSAAGFGASRGGAPSTSGFPAASGAAGGGAGGLAPTVPPGAYPAGGYGYGSPWPARRRFRLSDGMRQFLLALTAGILLGAVIVGVGLGVRNAYGQYVRSLREKAALDVYTQAVKAYNAGRFGDAIRDFSVAAKRASGTDLATKARHAIVQSYLQLGDAQMGADLVKATAYYRAATAVEPNNPETYLRLGDALERLGHLDEAIGAWQKVIDLDGFGDLATEARRQQSLTYYNRAASEFNVGNRSLARDYWQKAIDADPAGPLAARAEMNIRSLYPSAWPAP